MPRRGRLRDALVGGDDIQMIYTEIARQTGRFLRTDTALA